MDEDYKIREAKVEDCDAIFGLVLELAALGNMTDGVRVTAERLKELIFETKSLCCLVLENTRSTNTPKRSTIVGIATYCYTSAAFEGKGMYIDSLYLKAEYRRKGLGTKLLSACAKIAIENKCDGEFYLFALGPNKDALKFYEKIGFTNTTFLEQYYRMVFNHDRLKELSNK